MKKSLIGVAIVILLFAVAIVWLFGSLDKIVEDQIEVIGSEIFRSR